MDLVNRYLHAVKFWLPKGQQDDIIAELGEDLRSQIENREAELGHPLDDDAVAAILKQRGDPMWVAGYYLPPRPVIGQALAPVYWFILRLVILWVLIPVFVLIVGPATLLASKNPAGELIELIWTLLMSAVFAFGTITLIFVALERYPHESTWKWDPRRLPRVPAFKGVTGPQPVRGYTAIFGMLAAIAYAVIWCYAIWFHTSFHIHGIELTLAPLWRTFFWPLLLVLLSGVPLGLMGWRHPEWIRARTITRLAVDGLTLVLIGALVRMGPWVTISAASLPASDVANANHWTNVGVSIGLSFMSLATLVDAVQEAVRLTRASRGSPVSGRPSPNTPNSVGRMT
jgi:hypothetical protein